MSLGVVAERLGEVRRRIAAACARAGRRPEEVVLVGASKAQPVERLLAAWEAGVQVFGENRVQEARAKSPALPPAAEWHLLGPLQSNKVKPAVELFRMIHSLDRVAIAEAIDREAARRGLRLEGLIEVHLGEEPSKHGLAPEDLAAAAGPLARLENLRIVGLMAIPPLEDDPEAARRWFRALRALRDELARRPEWAGWPGYLSMGMSGDFEAAIEEGATHVRIGTALFGPREPHRVPDREP